MVAARHRSSHGNGARYGQYARASRTSSRTSSPSLHTSDLPELSDCDVEIVNSKMGRVPQDPAFNRALFHSSQKVLDHAFWKSRYAEYGAPMALSAYDQEAAGDPSKSALGVPTTLHYVRKPGPINASNNTGASKLAAGFSPHKGTYGHKRYGPEHGFHTRPSRGEGAAKANTDLFSKQGSTECATSSTPKSKFAVTSSSSAKRLQSTTSDSTLGASFTKTPQTSAGSGVRHVSDTVVHTLRKTMEPFTAVDASVETYRRSSVRQDSLALSTLKDVARSHGMMDGTSRTMNSCLHGATKESSVPSLGRPARLPQLNMKPAGSSKYPPAFDHVHQNSQMPLPDQQGACTYSDDGHADQSSLEGKGHARKRVPQSRSPSPPTWASWAEDEFIEKRRGRSARRGQ